LKSDVVACPNFQRSLLGISSIEKRNRLGSFRQEMIEI
jgi:hypothetical protein